MMGQCMIVQLNMLQAKLQIPSRAVTVVEIQAWALGWANNNFRLFQSWRLYQCDDSLDFLKQKCLNFVLGMYNFDCRYLSFHSHILHSSPALWGGKIQGISITWSCLFDGATTGRFFQCPNFLDILIWIGMTELFTPPVDLHLIFEISSSRN